MKYVAYDYEIDFWHIFALDTDKGALMGAGSVMEILGPDTKEMQDAIVAICKAIDAAVDIAEK